MILLAVPVLAGALLLVVAGLEHIRNPAELARAAGTGTVLARLIAVVELLIGVPSVAAVFFGVPPLRWALVAQAVIYVAFAAHLLLRRWRRDESDCGCNRMGTRVGPGGIARAWSLAALTLVASVFYPGVASASGLGSVLLVIGAVVTAVLLYAMPAAVDGPAVHRGTT